MAIQHVDAEYASGMEAFVRLMEMIQLALEVAEIPIYRNRARAGKDFYVFYVGQLRGAKPYAVKVFYKYACNIRFEFSDANANSELILDGEGWEEPDPKPYRSYRLDHTFFDLDADQQLQKLATFFKQSYELMTRATATPAVPDSTPNNTIG